MLPASYADAAPLQYLSGAGDKADPVVGLTWGVLAISVIVTILIATLLAGAIGTGRAMRLPDAVKTAAR